MLGWFRRAGPVFSSQGGGAMGYRMTFSSQGGGVMGNRMTFSSHDGRAMGYRMTFSSLGGGVMGYRMTFSSHGGEAMGYRMTFCSHGTHTPSSDHHDRRMALRKKPSFSKMCTVCLYCSTKRRSLKPFVFFSS